MGMRVDDATPITSDRTYDGFNGTLDVLGQNGIGPFVRAFVITGANPEIPRGDHAHRSGTQTLWAIKGDWLVKAEAGHGGLMKRELHWLRERKTGLIVPPLNWMTIRSCGKDGILLVLCSDPYTPESYIRDRAEWEKAIQ